MMMALFLHVKLEKDAAGILRVDVGLRPAVATVDATHRLNAVSSDRRGGDINVLDLEGHVVQARPLVFQEAMEIAALVKWLQQLEVSRATRNAQTHAAEANLRVLEPALDGHSHQIGQEREHVVDVLHGPADMVEPLDPHLVRFHTSSLLLFCASEATAMIANARTRAIAQDIGGLELPMTWIRVTSAKRR